MLNWSEKGHVLATFDDSVVYCRVVGIGNMNNSATYQDFSCRLQKQGYHEFVLDFSQCEGLDSTFLGILLGIALGNQGMRCKVLVVNASDSIRRILTEVGIDRLLEVFGEPMRLPSIPMRRLDEIPGNDADRINMILEAHENLCRLAGSNKQRFGSFIEILRTELAGTKEQDSDSSKNDPGSKNDLGAGGS